MSKYAFGDDIKNSGDHLLRNAYLMLITFSETIKEMSNWDLTVNYLAFFYFIFLSTF